MKSLFRRVSTNRCCNSVQCSWVGASAANCALVDLFQLDALTLIIQRSGQAVKLGSVCRQNIWLCNGQCRIRRSFLTILTKTQYTIQGS